VGEWRVNDTQLARTGVNKACNGAKMTTLVAWSIYLPFKRRCLDQRILQGGGGDERGGISCLERRAGRGRHGCGVLMSCCVGFVTVWSC